MTVILTSGPIATGKTAVATELAARLSAEIIRVREALRHVLGIDMTNRRILQHEGADLDRRTNGRWLRDYVEEHHGTKSNLVVDSLRTRRQTIPILESFTNSRLVYLDASADTRRKRYAEAAAKDPVKASVDFETAMHHATELQVVRLRPLANVLIATDGLTVSEVADEIQSALGLLRHG